MWPLQAQGGSWDQDRQKISQLLLLMVTLAAIGLRVEEVALGVLVWSLAHCRSSAALLVYKIFVNFDLHFLWFKNRALLKKKNFLCPLH